MSIRLMTRIALATTLLCVAGAFIIARFTDWPLTYSALLHNFAIVGLIISLLLFFATWYNRARHAEE